jgi:glycosyltransferase involved in cell wall biosynthesis
MSPTNDLPRIGFIGSMNAMPMAYALKFRRDGFDVRYAVEARPDVVLMRPEHQYAREVPYPYPEWIVEHPVGASLTKHAFAPQVYKTFVRAMADRDIVFLNDWALALAPYLPRSTCCVALSSGSDIDVYCNPATPWVLALQTRRKWLMPVRWLLEHVRLHRQRRGLHRCQLICYFPPGLNPVGDRLVQEAVDRHPAVRIVHRYDVNFAAAGVCRQPQPQRKLKKILVPVRFNTDPHPASRFEYKGNDLIIEALGRYSQRNPGIEVHLFEKGPEADLARARQQIAALGMRERVVWHREMPLRSLLDLYADCDLCFDQVGAHFMGAIGCYALYTGRPLITNARLDVFGALWGDDPPLLHADSVDSILTQLERCESQEFRDALGERAHRFAAEKLDTERVYADLRKAVLAAWSGTSMVAPLSMNGS